MFTTQSDFLIGELALYYAKVLHTCVFSAVEALKNCELRPCLKSQDVALGNSQYRPRADG
jgi:hypothetical protein